MFGKKKRFSDMGEVQRDTNRVIDEAIEKQQEIKKMWSSRRPTTLAVSNPKPKEDKTPKDEKIEPIAVLPKSSAIFNDEKGGFFSNYWFPLLCAAAVVAVAIWTFWPSGEPKPVVVPEPVVNAVDQSGAEKNTEQPAAQPSESEPAKTNIQTGIKRDVPTFDIVRIEADGALVVAGKCDENNTASVFLNGKIVATVTTNADGDFVYAPKNKLKPGNYVLQIKTAGKESEKVFIYVADKPGDSMSLLMSSGGTKVLQGPKSLSDGALVVSKIDYIANKRLVVSGRALPRLRVSLSLDGKTMGMARVSDHKNFGLGAGVGELKAGANHVLIVNLHDAQGNNVASVKHEFIMPEMTDPNQTFYVVRKGDCLWVIARNFIGKGIRFSVIAAENKIKNPDLIYPNRKLKIPVK